FRSINRNDLDPRFQGMFDRMAEKAGITNGQMTKEQFDAYQQQRAAERGGGTPGGGPGPRGDRGGPGTPGGQAGPSAEQTSSWAEGMFRRYDLNGDGYLNNDEMPEALRIERDKYDLDRNGLI